MNRTRWWILSALFLATVINFVDRQALSVVQRQLLERLQITNEQYGYIVSAFMAGMLIGEFPQGAIMDRIGTRLGLSFAVLWWSAAQAMHAFAGSLTTFMGLRFWLGTGECGNYSGANKTITQWFPPRERAFAVGVFNAGSVVGSMVALPLLTWILLKWGWEWVFLAPSALGFAWVVYWMSVLPKVTGPYAALDEPSPPSAWLLGQRQVWGVMLCRLLVGPVVQFYLFWLPAYLQKERGLSLKEVGTFGWVPFLFGDLGSIAGGAVAVALIHRGWSARATRRLTMGFGAACCLASLGIFGAPNTTIAIVLISIVLFGHYFLSANMFAAISDLLPAQAVGRTTALTGIAGGISGAVFPTLTGRLVDQVSYAPVFALAAIMPLAGVLALFLLNPKFERAGVAKS